MILDLSHEISAGMVTYQGLAAPELRTVITREDSIDSPFHFRAELAAPVRGMASFPVRAVAAWAA
jgi:hypothetical protein